MRERPILFSGPMVRAILAGTKTQTRRVISPRHLKFFDQSAADMIGSWDKRPLPYGAVGEHLWVRESHSPDFAAHYPCEPFWYRADDDRRHDIEVRDGVRGIYSPESAEFVPFRWRPSIHMPRRACRIVLEITDVRVERLQEISEDDCVAEGIEPFTDFLPAGHWRRYRDGGWNSYVDKPIASYASLWTEINGAGSWEANPWVWAITFKRVEVGRG